MSLSLDRICAYHSDDNDDCLRIMLMTGASLCLVVLVLGSVLPSHAGGFSPFWKGTTRLFQVLSSSSSDNDVVAAAKDDKSFIGNEQLEWWQDLAPPFSLNRDDDSDDDDIDDDFSSQDENGVLSRSSSSPTEDENESSSPMPKITHFCFLVHGHRGYSRDLSYIQAKMERVTEKRRRKHDKDILRHDLVVHSTTCNEKKTDDGVINGGERLVEEILQVIRTKMNQRPNQYNATISFLGNSLGGIYSRYAAAKLFERCKKLDDGHYLLDDIYHVHFNVFCTTATPHLGVAGHTFLPLPRTAEIGVAHAMGDTGKDLFRLNDLMKRMATAAEFIQPLRAFRKRIAYANAYGTDFPVPLQTAAFLSESSTYPHHFVEDSHDDDRLVVDDNGLVIATLHTPPQHYDDDNDDECKGHECFLDDEESDELVEMSRSLDSLGWKKVFVDVRKEIPQISLPKVLSRKSSNNTTPESGTPPSESDSGEAIHRLKEKGVVSSRDVAAALTTPLLFDEKLYWPMGHNMMVAFSRSRLSTYLHKAGRPVVDSLANELVQSIFSWKEDEKSKSATAAKGQEASTSQQVQEISEKMVEKA